ncbi:unnamed protein product, partial [Discosporangium mesarthrocarpum]
LLAETLCGEPAVAEVTPLPLAPPGRGVGPRSGSGGSSGGRPPRSLAVLSSPADDQAASLADRETPRGVLFRDFPRSPAPAGAGARAGGGELGPRSHPTPFTPFPQGGELLRDVKETSGGLLWDTPPPRLLSRRRESVGVIPLSNSGKGMAGPG